jgi:hypothetical protein
VRAGEAGVPAVSRSGTPASRTAVRRAQTAAPRPRPVVCTAPGCGWRSEPSTARSCSQPSAPCGLEVPAAAVAHHVEGRRTDARAARRPGDRVAPCRGTAGMGVLEAEVVAPARAPRRRTAWTRTATRAGPGASRARASRRRHRAGRAGSGSRPRAGAPPVARPPWPGPWTCAPTRCSRSDA